MLLSVSTASAVAEPFCSNDGTGLFTTGIIGFSFARLDQIRPRAEEIIKAAEENISRNADNYPPGLLEQYKISLERLRNGVGQELVTFPGCNSQPSMFSLWSASLHRLTIFRHRPT